MSDSPPELEELKESLNPKINETPKIPDSQDGQNIIPSTQKINSEKNITSKSMKNYRRKSEKKPRIKNYNLTSERDTQKKNWVNSTKEAIELNHTMKDFQWKFGMLLNEKINTLTNELKTLKGKIDEQQIQNYNESLIFDRRKNELKNQIEKEEKEGYEIQKKINNSLNQRKKELLNDIEQLETKKKNIKSILNDKFKEMMKLKQTLKLSINQLDLIKKEILSRKFANNDKSNILDKTESDDFKFDSNSNNISEIPHKLNEFSNYK